MYIIIKKVYEVVDKKIIRVDLSSVAFGTEVAGAQDEVQSGADPADISKMFQVPPQPLSAVEQHIKSLKSKYKIVNVIEKVLSASDMAPETPDLDAKYNKKKEQLKRELSPKQNMGERDIEAGPSPEHDKKEKSMFQTLKEGGIVERENAARDHGLSKKQIEKVRKLNSEEQAKISGMAGYGKLEAKGAKLITAEDTKILAGNHNHEIVFCRDRSDQRELFDGYGNTGDVRCSAIDIVVGRFPEKMAASDTDTAERMEQLLDVPAKERLYTMVDFENEAARIYISQRADIDRYFLPPFYLKSIKDKSKLSVGRSAIALKADDIRIISRTGPMRIGTIGSGVRTSNLGRNDFREGVYLIGGMNMSSEKDLQPMVKGDNLVKLMRIVESTLKKIHSTTSSLWKNQMSLNMELALHYHSSPFYGIPTSFPANIANMFKPIMALYSETGQNFMLSRIGMEIDFEPFLNEGPTYICSGLHKLN